MKNNKIKVGIYARVSTASQASDGFSIQAQIDTITKHCQQEGYEVYDIYADRGVSGTSTEKRFELQRLMQDAASGKLNKVYVWKISRMARNTSDLLHIVEELQRHNVEFKSISENFEVGSTTGKLIAQILASFSEYERNVTVDNLKEGQTARALAGLTNGARILGYDKPEYSRDPIIVNKNESKIIKKIFDLYDQSGKGYRSIAVELNRLGYKTKRGNAFGIPAIRDILANPTYKGYVRFLNYTDWNTKGRRFGKNPNPILVPGKHEAIISEIQWERVQRKLQQRSTMPKILGDGTNLLTGIIRCPECMGAMCASTTTNTLKNGEKKRIRYYSCAAFRSKGTTVCHANSIRAEEIEDLVAKEILMLINQPSVLRNVIAAANSKQAEQQDRQVELQPELLDEAEDLSAKINNLTQMISEDASLAEILSDKITDYKQQLESIYVLMKKYKSAEKKQNLREYSEDEMHQVLDKIQRAFASKDKMNIKQLYLSIVQKITFQKDNPRGGKIATFTIYLKPDIGSTLLNNLNTDEDSQEASSFSLPKTGIQLHYKEF